MKYFVSSIRKPKVKSFTDLIAWQKAHSLVVDIYKVIKGFPKQELYSLADQMKRSAISISSNVAEGFSRQTKKEKVQFCFTSKGSITELQNQLLVAKDVNYISKNVFDLIASKTVEVHKLINGLIKSANAKY